MDVIDRVGVAMTQSAMLDPQLHVAWITMSAVEATRSGNEQRKLGENEECLKLPSSGSVEDI